MKLIEIPEIKEFIQIITKNLSVHCLLCVGSYASGIQDEKSDIDFLIIIEIIPNQVQRKEMYDKLRSVNNLELSKDISHWEPSWSPVNDTFVLNGKKFEVGYNTTHWVDIVIDNVMNKNEINFKEFPFRPYTFLGLLETSICLYEEDAYFTSLKSKIRPFPHSLKKEIVNSHYPILCDSYFDLQDALDREIGILAYQHFIFMAIDATVELLWVINDVYSPASKRSEIFLAKLNMLPPNFMFFLENVLPNCYKNKKEFLRYIKEIKEFLEKELKMQDLIEKKDHKYLPGVE